MEGCKILMTSRNKGQLRIGKSGYINIGNATQESSIPIKIGRSGPISIGNDIIRKEEEKEEDRLKKEEERLSKKEEDRLKKEEERLSKKEEDRLKKKEEEDILKKKEKRSRKEEDKLKKKEDRLKKEQLEKKWLEIIGKKTSPDKGKSEVISKEDDIDIKDQIIIKFTNKLDEFNILVQDNKISGRPWHDRLDGSWWQGMSEDEARMIIESGRDLDNIGNIESDQSEIEDSQKTEGSPIPESQIRTVSDMIDQMTGQYNRDLPKDVEKRISYIYPLDSTHSFHIVAVNHIRYLRYKHTSENRYVEIEEIDWSQLSNIDWNEKRSILLHPFLYPFASEDSFIQNSKNFARLLAMKNKIGGFDVADSDRISKPATDLINKIDLIMVPSNFVKETYIKSGVTIPVEVLPHGISDKFSSDDIVITDNEKIMKLRKMRQKGKILILYFLVHSPHRKGADLVKRVMKRIQRKYNNVYLVVRSKKCDYFSEIRSICIDSWLSDNDLVALYDSCDICLSPSRGGGFELNALEAVSRGIPTLVPNGGCFTDLMNYFIPVNLSDKTIQSLPGNTIHIGSGCQIDMDNFEDKLTDTINKLDYWRDHSKSMTKEIREKYSWMNTAKILDEYLRKHGFIV